MNDHGPELSAIVLCYRAEESILRILEPLERSLEDAAVSHELVLVANYWPGQGDRTPEIVARYAETAPNTVVIAEPKHGGMGWDMRAGLGAARGGYLVVIDGDAQNPVADVIRMYELMRGSGADVGKGRRTNRADSAYRRFISKAYNALFRLMFGMGDLWDINGKPKALTREAFERMSLVSDDWFIDAEMVLQARRLGLTVVELPVVFLENPERSSFVRVSSIVEFAAHMVRYRLKGRV